MQTVAQHFIGGDFADSIGRETVDIFNPATGEQIGRATLGNEADAERAIAAAKAAFPAWSQTTLEERKVFLGKLAAALTERLDDLKSTMIAEYGSPAWFAGYVVDQARDFFNFAQNLLDAGNFEQVVGKAKVKKVPLGVAGLMTPWNGSAWFVCGKAASALAAGCTVVIKPSELSVLQSQILMECFKAAGLPAGVINLVNGRGDTVGNTITRSPDVQKISFTGSTRVGKMINREATETMKRVTLELGGKSPTIILDDADLASATQLALGAGMMNTGQACIAGTRILVPESRLAEFEDALKAGIESMKIGNPAEPDTMVQPMVSQSHWERVQGYIRKGIEEGATVLTGGEGKPEGFEQGNYVKPTILTGVRNDMTIAQEEIFGPVLSIIPYKTDDEAVEIANNVPYGLHAYICGQDQDRAGKLADRLLVGRVMINELVDDPIAPFGGFKLSGMGREFGLEGMLAYTEMRAVFG
nr:aldehyde dehydrogenase family protein [Sphingomonas sp. CDS-1]